MTTGTEGPDHLTNDSSHDVITIQLIGGVHATAVVDGGAGFDLLQSHHQWNISSSEPGRIFLRSSSSTSMDITYTNVERLEFIGRYFTDQVLVFGNTQDWITLTGTGGAPAKVQTGGGDDRIYLTGFHPGATLDAGAGNDLIDLSGSQPVNNQYFLLYGRAGDDRIIGSTYHDRLEGGEGNDNLSGGAGNDVLIGDAGIDRLEGGTGDDLYFVDGSDSVYELAGEGIDIVYASTSFVLTPGAHIDLLAAISSAAVNFIELAGNEIANTIQGNDGDNFLYGFGGNDYLTGFGGNDLLDGGDDADFLVGGLGDDRYLVSLGDTLIENAGEGYDTVYARTSYVLSQGAHVEFLAAISGAATDPIDLTGNELGNLIQGNAGANVLRGLAGNDYLDALGGNDTLDGGEGQDFLDGGAGADTFRFTSVSHSSLGLADTVSGFVSGQDKIDLSQIDANSNTAGDDAFTFIGTGAFTHTAGQLRYEQIGTQTHLYGDVNGDGVADLHIVVNNGPPVASDLFL